MVRASMARQAQRSNVCQTQQDICTYELTTAVTAGTQPAQAPARQNLSMKRGGSHNTPARSEELSPI